MPPPPVSVAQHRNKDEQRGDAGDNAQNYQQRIESSAGSLEYEFPGAGKNCEDGVEDFIHLRTTRSSYFS